MTNHANWIKYGCPREMTPKVLKVVDYVRELSATDESGGNLHHIVCDWNIEDEHVQGPMHVINNASTQQIWLEAMCQFALAALTLAERATVLAIVDGALAGPREGS